MQRTNWKKMLAALAITMIAFSCGDEMMTMTLTDAGDMLVDAGGALLDGAAGVDAFVPDAAAQDCATNCSSGGALRVTTADTDPAQLLSGVSRGTAQVVATGPFVLTDATVDARYFSNGTHDATFYLGASGDCAVEARLLTRVYSYRDSGGGSRADVTLSGGRISVAAGNTLCVTTVGTTIDPEVYWSGFRPYE